MRIERTRVDLESISRLTDLANYIIPFAIRAIASLGVADYLANAPRPVEELATLMKLNASSLRRVLRALTSKGIFEELDDDRFALTRIGHLLRSDHPHSVRNGLQLLPVDVAAWAHLDYSVRTGESAFEHVHGVHYWRYLAEHQEESRRFDLTQETMTRLESRALLRVYDWSSIRTIVDVGGGTGALLADLLARYPAMRGTLFDQPHVVAGVSPIAKAGVAERCTIIGGDYFTEVPSGAEAYVVKRILWGYNDHQALSILRNIRAAMPERSKLLVIEPILERGGSSEVAKILDLQMLVLGGGQARTPEELRGLLADAGLQQISVLSTLVTSIIEARRT